MAIVTKPIVLDETVKEFNENLTGILNNLTKAEEKANEAAASATLASNKAAEANTSLIQARAIVDGLNTIDTSGVATQVLKNTADIALINGVNEILFDKQGYVTGEGAISSNSSYKRTDYIDLYKNGIFIPLYYKANMFNNAAIGFYDESKNIVKVIKPTTSSSLTVVEGAIAETYGAKYVMFCSYNTYNASVKYCNFNDLALEKDSINTNNIVDKAITRDKANFVIHDINSDFIKPNSITKGGYVNDNNGNITITGANIWYTDFIDVTPNTRYYHDLNVSYNGYYGFYDKDKKWLGGKNQYPQNTNHFGTGFLTPEGAYYLRFTLTSEEKLAKAWLSINNGVPKPYSYVLDGVGVDTSKENSYCDYSGDDIVAFTKCICIGDSLTAGTMNHTESGTTEYISFDKYSFPRNLERLTGLEVTNKGRGGHTSAEWWDVEKNNDLSGFDFAIIQLGVNDTIRYGTFGNTSKTAFTNIFNKLKAENKKIKIFVANILPATSYGSAAQKQFSDDLLAWVEGLHQTDVDIIPLNIQQYGKTNDAAAYNCGHLSAYGYYRLARDYKAYISYYMNTHKDEFNQIQFIGTDYSYN